MSGGEEFKKRRREGIILIIQIDLLKTSYKSVQKTFSKISKFNSYMFQALTRKKKEKGQVGRNKERKNRKEEGKKKNFKLFCIAFSIFKV